jgi:hypothetical protein
MSDIFHTLAYASTIRNSVALMSDDDIYLFPVKVETSKNIFPARFANYVLTKINIAVKK